MKNLKKVLFIILVPFLVFLLPMTSSAKDTDLYTASGEGVEPNILIIFDNSGSMNDVMYYVPYDPNRTYAGIVVPTANRDIVYKYIRQGGQWQWVLYGTSTANSRISDVLCATARNALTNLGQYTGFTNAACNSTSLQLRTGNYRNYWADVDSRQVTKLEIAQDTIKNLIDSVTGVRIGIMIFNPSVTDNTTHGGSNDRNSHGGRILSSIVSLTEANKTTLKNQVDAIVANTWTPLAETLYEAGLYFKGGASYFNSGVTYVSPIQYYCQRNYIIYMTDGDPTRDDGYRPGDTESPSDPPDPRRHNHILKTAIGDQDGDGREPGGANEVTYIVDGSNHLGTDYLDDVAKYLYDSDLRINLTGKQNIITYTIGFAITPQHNLLGRAASLGGGEYYQADNAAQLATAFQNIVGGILDITSSFVAPIVPVSRMERTSAGDRIYLALFQPKQNRMWSGNIKKYGVTQTGTNIGQITGINGLPALDDLGQILNTTYSFWPSPFPLNRMDGSGVEKGGVGDILLNRSTGRNVYTYLGSNVNLPHSSNTFNTTNITPTMLGLSSGDTVGRDKLLQFVLGFDAYDQDVDGDTTEKRDWILGSFLHSRPLVIHYASQTVIFAGSNDGMLHAFDDNSGEELWGFIPPNLLNKLQALNADVLEEFVDGSPKAYIARNADGSINRAILILGLRRGGNRYYALDITNPSSPRYLWEINPDIPGSPFAEMGQSWSTPNIGKIAYGAGEKWVAFIGGGYDENQDNANPVSDSKGRAIYVVDVLTGSLVWRYSVTENAAMTYSIPSDMAKVDTDGNGKIDRLYVGDMGGRVWRFDIGDPNTASWTGKIIFSSNPGRDGTTGRKIFYPPDVTLEKDTAYYQMLFFGTGDREHPKEDTVINRLYAVKDKNPSTALTEQESDLLVDVTEDLLQNPNTPQEIKNTILGQLQAGNGWFIKLDQNVGEKSLSPPVVFNKIAYFTTFAPTPSGDPCDGGLGTARVYILEYNTGNAVFNLDLTNDIGGPVISRTDRSEIIGGAIPSGVVITFIGGEAVAYIGVGGGVVPPPITGLQNNQKYWKIVF